MATRSIRGEESGLIPDWEVALRDAPDESLREVRYRYAPEGVDFLLIYKPGASRAAIARFLWALRHIQYDLPFDIRMAEIGSDDLTRYADYASVRT
jgi:hypothetical protein